MTKKIEWKKSNIPQSYSCSKKPQTAQSRWPDFKSSYQTRQRDINPFSRRPAQSTICRESLTHQLRHFVGLAALKRRPTVLWLYVLQGQTCLSLGFVPNLVLELKLLLRKSYLRCLFRFWFGGNLERELGEAFSPLQFAVRESEVSDEDLFVCA